MTNKYCPSIVVLIAFTLAVSAQAEDPFTEIFEDFRADADYRDAAPLLWNPTACCPGSFSADENGLRFTSVGQFPAILHTERKFEGNLRVRGFARGTPGIWIYLHLTNESRAYVGGIRENGKAVLNRMSGLGQDDKEEQDLDFSPEDGVWIEVCVIDAVVEVRVWPEDSCRPETPTLSRRDESFRAGVIAIQARDAVWESVAISRVQRVCEDFAGDANPFDNAPLLWQRADCCPGEFAADVNGLRFDSPDQFPAVLYTKDQFAGNLRVRTFARGAPGIWLYVYTDDSSRGYVGGIRENGNVVLKRRDSVDDSTGEEHPSDIDPRDGVWLEICVAGSAVELRVWREDSCSPVTPTLSRKDGTYRVGVIAMQARQAVFSTTCIEQPETDLVRPITFLRGDCNDDGEVNFSDATCALDWLFVGAPEPGCVAALNTDGDAAVDVADPVSLLNFLFGGGPIITAPFPNCGPGNLPADADLGCAHPPNCQ